MESTVQQRALDILEAALEMPQAEQRTFLACAAHDDAALAAELRRLEPARHHAARLLDRGGMSGADEDERDDGLFE